MLTRRGFFEAALAPAGTIKRTASAATIARLQ
jgi:hypothetical protein